MEWRCRRCPLEQRSDRLQQNALAEPEASLDKVTWGASNRTAHEPSLPPTPYRNGFPANGCVSTGVHTLFRRRLSRAAGGIKRSPLSPACRFGCAIAAHATSATATADRICIQCFTVCLRSEALEQEKYLCSCRQTASVRREIRTFTESKRLTASAQCAGLHVRIVRASTSAGKAVRTACRSLPIAR
jgi:hypothetical protein